MLPEGGVILLFVCLMQSKNLFSSLSMESQKTERYLKVKSVKTDILKD